MLFIRQKTPFFGPKFIYFCLNSVFNTRRFGWSKFIYNYNVFHNVDDTKQQNLHQPIGTFVPYELVPEQWIGTSKHMKQVPVSGFRTGGAGRLVRGQ